jgi:hypothetical protein
MSKGYFFNYQGSRNIALVGHFSIVKWVLFRLTKTFPFGRAFPIENRAPGFREGLLAGFALKTLHSFGGFPGLFDILLLISLQFPVLGTACVWTKIAAFGKLFHPSPSDLFAFSLHQAQTTLKRETINLWDPKISQQRV